LLFSCNFSQRLSVRAYNNNENACQHFFIAVKISLYLKK
jgi:hypothetical protein